MHLCQTILKKLYAETLHVLSLSDLRYLRGLAEHRSSVAISSTQLSADDSHRSPPFMVESEPRVLSELLTAAQQSWNEEKQSILSSVESLKTLLAHVQPDSTVSIKQKQCYLCKSSSCYMVFMSMSTELGFILV